MDNIHREPLLGSEYSGAFFVLVSSLFIARNTELIVIVNINDTFVDVYVKLHVTRQQGLTIML